jgi:branched-chain amino acid transport system substrate-binding protein
MKGISRFFMKGAVGILLVGALLLGGCKKGEKSSEGEKSESNVIKIGVILPLTGSHAKFGEMEKNSYEIAYNKILKGKTFKGKKVVFIYEDDTGKPAVGKSAAEKLIEKDNVVMIAGGYSSSVTYAIASLVQEKKVPFLVNTGSADKITMPSSFGVKEGEKFYIFRLNPPVSEYSTGVESFLKEVVKPKTAVILHENSLFGQKGAKAFQKVCKKLGIKVLAVEGYDKSTPDFKPVLLRIKKLNPDLIYMISYVIDAATIMKNAREIKLVPGKAFIGGAAGFTLPAFYENAGLSAEKVFSATLWHEVLPYPGAGEYAKEYKKMFGKTPDYHGAEAYAAVQVIADVLSRADDPTDKNSIYMALENTDTMTVFGPVKFISYGGKVHQNKLTSYVAQWIDGKLELVWPPASATKKYVFPVDWLKVWKLK